MFADCSTGELYKKFDLIKVNAEEAEDEAD